MEAYRIIVGKIQSGSGLIELPFNNMIYEQAERKNESMKGVAWVRISWLCWRAESLSLTTRSRGYFGQSEGQKRASGRFIWFLPRLSFLPAAQNNAAAICAARMLFCLPPPNERTDGLSEFNLFFSLYSLALTGHEYSMRNGLFTGAPRHQGRARRSQRHLNWTLNYYELRSAACGVRAAQFAGAQRLIWQKCSMQRSLGQFSLGRR